MNIFVLHKDPIRCARHHCNKHVVKMILETAQMLSTAHQLKGVGGEPYYRPAYVNHPCTKWVRKTSGNYFWTQQLFEALCDEYTRRYDKIHLCDTKLRKAFQVLPRYIRYADITKRPQAMPTEFKNPDVVKAYRDYYCSKPWDMKWYNRSTPSWYLRNVEA